MSASFLPVAHIDSMVSLALYGPQADPKPWLAHMELYWPTGNPDEDLFYAVVTETPSDPSHLSGQDFGRMLWEENARSVAFHHQLPELPAQMGGDELAAYRFTPVLPPSLIGCFRMLDAYDYESCEHPGWEGSQAKAAVQAMRERLISLLPGFQAEGGHIQEARPLEQLPSLQTHVQVLTEKRLDAVRDALNLYARPDSGVFLLSKSFLRELKREGWSLDHLQHAAGEMENPPGREQVQVVDSLQHPLIQTTKEIFPPRPRAAA